MSADRHLGARGVPERLRPQPHPGGHATSPTSPARSSTAPWRPPGSTAADIGVVHVGNAFGQLFTGQGQLGAMPATVRDDLWGLPASRHEAACASGSIAHRSPRWPTCGPATTTARSSSGWSWRRRSPGDEAAAATSARPPGSGTRARSARFMWPHMFSQVADEYDRRYGLDEVHLRRHRRAQLRQRHAATPTPRPAGGRCPTSSATSAPPTTTTSTRSSRAGSAASTAARSPTAAPGWCCVSDAWLRGPPEAPVPMARVLGWGHRTVGLGLRAEAHPRRGRPLRAAARARRPCRTPSPGRGVALDDLDGLETHDCFTPSEYLAIDHIGLTGPGESWKAIENGEIELGGTPADQPQRRAHRRRPPGRRHRRADARSTRRSRSAAPRASTRSRAPAPSPRSTSVAAPPPPSASSSARAGRP